jgi:lipoate-protein ligase A
MSAEKQIWQLVRSRAESPAFNMAMDEVLLGAVSQFGGPILRFYSWSAPAASFGYFQKYIDVERVTKLRPLVRRPTGGGVVPHDSDWTYSVVFPVNHEWYAFTAEESYRSMHHWLLTAFAKLGISTKLANCFCRDFPGQCFKGYEKHDLLWHGQKIAGAAQRRTRSGLLIQGSVQPPPIQLTGDAWQESMCQVLADWNSEWTTLVPSPALQERARVLAREKYSQPSYTTKR